MQTTAENIPGGDDPPLRRDGNVENVAPTGVWPKRAATLILPLIGAAIVLFVTRDGAGLSPDARGYLMGARHLATGRGYTILNGDGVPEPLTQFPPLYSVLLAPAEIAGISAITWSRFLNAALFAVSVSLVARVARLCGASWSVAAVCAALFALSPDLLFLHAMVLSEPTFIACSLVAFLLLGGYLQDEARWKLIGAGLALAAALAVRYSAPPLIGAAGLCLLFNARRPIARRVGDALLLGVIAAAPMAVWMMRNAQLTGSAGGRPVAFHPPESGHYDDAMKTLSYWLLPGSGDTVAITGCVLTASIAIVAMVWAWRQGATRRLIALTVACYLAFIVLSITFVDALTPMDKRILAPVHVALIVLVPLWVSTLRFPPQTLPKIAAVFLLVMAVRAGGWVNKAPKSGLGFACRQWRESELGRFIRALPPDALIYTNTVDFLYLGQNRFAKPIPRLYYAVSRKQDVKYRERLRTMSEELQARGGYLIHFSTIKRAWLPTEDRLRDDLPLNVVHAATDGKAYQLD
ncbi:MAG: phospholipid carrier-dependent glycosyltransferase [Planctomycetota bacterium]|nr:phospholipid carrier-dependent glycosyltransferase [Planctomycetota bacterium]